MSAWFYMLRLQSGKLYPGATTNLDQRWKDHVAGHGCRTTKLDPPVELTYQEEYPTFSDARRREAQIKRWSRNKKEALVAAEKQILGDLSTSHDHNSTGRTI